MLQSNKKRKQGFLVIIIHFQDTSGPANLQTLNPIMPLLKRGSWEGSSWVSRQEISQEFPEARLCFVFCFVLFLQAPEMSFKVKQIWDTEESERQYHWIKDTFTLKWAWKLKKNSSSIIYWLTLAKLSDSLHLQSGITIYLHTFSESSMFKMLLQ